MEIKTMKNRVETKINKSFYNLVQNFDKYTPFIPEKIKKTIKFYIGSEVIRFEWNENKKYKNSIIAYFKDLDSETKNGEYHWEIIVDSGRFYVCSSQEQYKNHDCEYFDIVKFSIGIYHFINCCKEKIAALHKEYYNG